MPKPPELHAVEEVCRLVDSACDGVLTEIERQRLNALLDQGVELRTVYLRYVALHSALTTTAGKQAIQGIEEFTARLLNLTEEPEAAPSRRFPQLVPRTLLGKAALIGAAFLPAALYVAASRHEQAALDSRRPGETIVAASNAQKPTPVDFAAWVDKASENARWVDPNDSYASQAKVAAGNSLRLAQGEVELRYESGVKLLLVGPAEFVVSNGGGELRRGGLMAAVPQAAHGFTIETPTGKIVDLGTQFGVVVDDFGVSEVSVFEGKVEALPTVATSATGVREKIELSEGNALQWSREMVRPLKADPRRLPVSLVSFSHAAEADSPVLLSPDGVTPPTLADYGDWSSIGEVRREGARFVLAGTGNPQDPPFLVSSKEIDPTLGPITIACDVQFPALKPQDDPAVAVLTRCENSRSALERPWKNALATSVRCSFRTTPDRGDGLLETATKYERDRELTSISWRGFQRPENSTTYRLVMRDDGVNVRLTVSQLENPSVAKTVTCRSLFRGYKNFVAIEGWGGGEMIIEDLQVFQESPSDSVAGRFPSLRPKSPPKHAENLARRGGLVGLVPPDAELVVADDFEGKRLNRSTWSALGEVSLEGGRVCLGEAVADEHIDTFHPRPYLLTRAQFNPGSATVYVSGEIEFADNFLQGYGGSFAVMTRCEDRYGEGPEWAVSALAVGVRGNFWPAATRENHVLELHEKPSSRALTFLTGAGLDIDPRSRSYNFLLRDDGESAMLTLQDAATPGKFNSIEQRTGASVENRNGFIAFESCWGSPVKLDNVRIYRQRRHEDSRPSHSQ